MTHDTHGCMVPRRLTLRKYHECTRCMEFTILKLLKFIYIVCTADSIHNLKVHGVSYNTVTKMTVVHIDTAHQKLNLMSCSLSQILQMLNLFSIMVPYVC
jgi:hypothetical protein